MATLFAAPSLHSHYSFESVDSLFDVVGFMAEEDKLAGGDGLGWYGSTTLRTTNLPFGPKPPSRPPLLFPSGARASAPFRVARSPHPYPPFSAAAASKAMAHRRSRSSPDHLVTLADMFCPPSSSSSAASFASSLSPLAFPSPVPTPRCNSPASSLFSLTPSSAAPAQQRRHRRAHSISLHPRSAAAAQFAVFSAARPGGEAQPHAQGDLAATAARLQHSEVEVFVGGQAGVRVEGGNEVSVEGVVFEVLPTVVIEQGVAL
ncbi:hypothetical protein JCM10207_005469 [Rhodosporidiobolus poonsookiae]